MVQRARADKYLGNLAQFKRKRQCGVFFFPTPLMELRLHTNPEGASAIPSSSLTPTAKTAPVKVPTGDCARA